MAIAQTGGDRRIVFHGTVVNWKESLQRLKALRDIKSHRHVSSCDFADFLSDESPLLIRDIWVIVGSTGGDVPPAHRPQDSGTA